VSFIAGSSLNNNCKIIQGVIVMDMDFAIISAGLKNGWETFKNNAVAYIVGLLILIVAAVLCILVIPIVLIAPLMYGYYYMVVKGSRGEKVEIGDMFIAFKSVSAFIRSWIYWIVYFVVLLIIGVIAYLISSLVSVMLGSLIQSLLTLIWALIAFFSIYVYIMSPSKNAIDAYKEGLSILKSNLLMTIVTYIVYCVLCFIGFLLIGFGIFVTFPIALVFTVSVLKVLRPDIRDEA